MANIWAEIIDKMTDPLEVAIKKIFSARFLVVIGLALTLCLLARDVVHKFSDNKELVALVVGQFIFICKDIIIKYFDRGDRTSKNGGGGNA